MPLFIAPMLKTPLLKIPLLLSYAVGTWQGMAPPPQKPPSVKEQDRMNGRREFLTQTAWFNAIVKNALCGLAVAESIALLAQSFPSFFSFHILEAFPEYPLGLGLDTLALTGLSLGIGGGGIRVWCYRVLGRFFTWQMAVHDEHELITSGPYALARHPSYTGCVLMVVGNIALLTSPRSIFVAGGLAGVTAIKAGAVVGMLYMAWVCMQLLRRMSTEDDALREEFGAKWEEWAKRTPYKLFPWVY